MSVVNVASDKRGHKDLILDYYYNFIIIIIVMIVIILFIIISLETIMEGAQYGEGTISHIRDRKQGVSRSCRVTHIQKACNRARMFLRRQYVVVPLRVNVNLKAVTVEDLIARRKVRRLYCNT
jgi:hypothetical protein